MHNWIIRANALNKLILVCIGIVIVTVAGSAYLIQNQVTNFSGLDFDGLEKQMTDGKMHDVPKDLLYVTVSGKLKQYETPLNAPKSDVKPEFVLVTGKDYPELQDAIQVALYNVKHLPENPEHVQVSGYFDPKSPDWYYPEQGRTKQVIFVEEIIQLESIDLGNEYTTHELLDRYDQLQKEFENIKEELTSGEITHEQYVSTLEGLAEHEIQLYDDVKEHKFDRDEMTEYNFWHRGVMKFPTAIEQELSRNEALK